jgi:hypothetical protein
VRITFLPGSVVGYVSYPEALFTRGLADGLVERGHDVRIVEERQNDILKRTLIEVGAEPSRHFHQQYPKLRYHTFEPRTGAPLLEWVIGELSLVDVAVAVEGIGNELCRWIANLTSTELIRAYMTFRPEALTDEVATSLELEKYDVILSPSRPAAQLPWSAIPPVLAGKDDLEHLRASIPERLQPHLAAPESASVTFEQIIAVLRR